jgi:hypothetical protein
MEDIKLIRNRQGGTGPAVRLEDRYAYYRRCQMMRKSGQCKAPAMKGQQVCYKHAEQQDRARRCQREMVDVLMEGAARMGIGVQRVLRDPQARATMFGVVTQGILDGSIGDDAASLLLKELSR